MNTPLLDGIVKEAGTRFYHGTKPSLIDKILKEGLLPSYMGTGEEYRPEEREYPAISLASDVDYAGAYSSAREFSGTKGLLNKIKAIFSNKHPVLEINIPEGEALPKKVWSVAVGDRNVDEYHYPSRIPPEWISSVNRDGKGA